MNKYFTTFFRASTRVVGAVFIMFCMAGTSYAQRDTTHYTDEEIEQKRLDFLKFMDEFTDLEAFDQSIEVRRSGKDKVIRRQDPNGNDFALGTALYTNLHINELWPRLLTGKWIYTPDGKIKVGTDTLLYYTLDFQFHFDTNATRDGFLVSAFVKPNKTFAAALGADSAASLSRVLSQLIAPKFEGEFKTPKDAPIGEAMDEVLHYLKLTDPDLWQRLVECSQKYKDLNANDDIKHLAEMLDNLIVHMDEHKVCIVDQYHEFMNLTDFEEINNALFELNRVRDKKIFLVAYKCKYAFTKEELKLIIPRILAESKYCDPSNTDIIFAQQYYNYACYDYDQVNKGRADLMATSLKATDQALALYESTTQVIQEVKDQLCGAKNELESAYAEGGKSGGVSTLKQGEGNSASSALNLDSTAVICGQEVESVGLHISELSSFVNTYNGKEYLTFITPSGSAIWIPKDQIAYVHFASAERWINDQVPLPMGSLRFFEKMNGEVYRAYSIGSSFTRYKNGRDQPYIDPVPKDVIPQFLVVGMTCIKERQFSFTVTNITEYWNCANYGSEKLTQEDALMTAFDKAIASNKVATSIPWRDLNFNEDYIKEVWQLQESGKASKLQESFESFLHMYEYDTDINHHTELCSKQVWKAMQQFKRFANIDLSVDADPIKALKEAGKNGNDKFVIYHKPSKTKYTSSNGAIVSDKLGQWPYTHAGKQNYYNTPVFEHTEEHGTAQLVFHYHDMHQQYSWSDSKKASEDLARTAGYVIDINCTKSYMHANTGLLELQFYGYMVGSNVSPDDKPNDCEAHVLSIVCEDIDAFNELSKEFGHSAGIISIRGDYARYKNQLITSITQNYNTMTHDQICGHIDLLGKRFSELSAHLRLILLAKVLDGSEYRTTYGEQFGLRMLRSFQDPINIRLLHNWLLKNNGKYLTELLDHYSDVDVFLGDNNYSQLWYILLHQSMTAYDYDVTQCTDEDFYSFIGYNYLRGAGFSANIDNTAISVQCNIANLNEWYYSSDFSKINGVRTYENPFSSLAILQFHPNSRILPQEFKQYAGKPIPVPAICLYILDDQDDNARIGKTIELLLYMSSLSATLGSGGGFGMFLEASLDAAAIVTVVWENELKVLGLSDDAVGYIHLAGAITSLARLGKIPARFAVSNRYMNLVNWEAINAKVSKLGSAAQEAWGKIYRRVRGVTSLDDIANGLTKAEFKNTFSAADNLVDQAWDLWKTQNWNELENLFKVNGINGGWPPNRGFIEFTTEPLAIGKEFDRYGGYFENGVFKDRGTFGSPKGAPFESRALPEETLNSPYKKYRVIKEIPEVKKGPAAPWFDQPGMGIQYEFPYSINELLEGGFITPIN